MTKLPNICVMEVHEWFDQMSAISETLETAIVDTLNTQTNAKAAWEVLNAVLEPYVIDASDETIMQLTTKVDGDVLYIGLIGHWLELTYRDAGYWWFKDKDPGLNHKGEEGTPDERHKYLAGCIISDVEWTDDLLHNQNSWHRYHRELGEQYLHAVQSLIGNGMSKASDFRPHLIKLAMAYCDEDTPLVMDDISPDDHHTHLTIRKDNTIIGRILAVAPNSTITFTQLLEKLGLDGYDDTIITITNHLYFEWGSWNGFDGINLKLPTEKYEDIETYFHSIEVLAATLGSTIKYGLWPSVPSGSP